MSRKRRPNSKASLDPYYGDEKYGETLMMQESCKSIDSNLRGTPSTQHLMTTEKKLRLGYIQNNQISM